MAERDGIENAINRFMNSFDLKDWSVMKALLLDEIQIDYSDLRGDPPATAFATDYVKARRDALEHLSTHHLMSNFEITVQSSEAVARASCVIFRTDGTTPFHSHAFYTFRLKRVDDGWRIAGIKQTIFWNEGRAAIHTGVGTKDGQNDE
jgi:DNA-binding MurR/RpiR family transcriptional regulator